MAVYRNLVFKGGGVRGVAYLGAMAYLHEHGLLRSVERTAGTSAGAITATIAALNFKDFATMKAHVDSLDYRQVPSEGDSSADKDAQGGASRLTDRLQSLGIVRNLQCSARLLQEKGWYSSEYFYSWMKNVIASCFTIFKESYTFRDFHDASLHKEGRPFFDLYITGTDISNRTPRVFSYETTPDMEVALAVRISMSIPLFFEAVEYQYPGTPAPQVYTDGGVMWNYPIGVFDARKYGRKITNGINEESLGFFLYTSPESTEYKELKGIVDYVAALFESLLLVQERLGMRGESSRERTIFIDDCGIPQTDFDIAAGDPKYDSLYQSGYRAAEEFFSRKFSLDALLHRLQKQFGWSSQRD